jgi:hypothetical protein
MARLPLRLEHLEDRCTPSGIVFDSPPAFHGLDGAVGRFTPVDPCLTASPVFALNYGSSADVPAVPSGLHVAVSQFTPTDPCMIASPIFNGLSQAPPPVDELPA